MIRPRHTLRRGELTREEKAAIRHAVFVRDGGRCVDCGTRVVEVLSGLADGEQVASPAATELKDGARVRIAPP